MLTVGHSLGDVIDRFWGLVNGKFGPRAWEMVASVPVKGPKTFFSTPVENLGTIAFWEKPLPIGFHLSLDNCPCSHLRWSVGNIDRAASSSSGLCLLLNYMNLESN